ncbi:MAG TPA: hypothetical protein VIV60_04080, partial [Polyangiaceae bacterium]
MALAGLTLGCLALLLWFSRSSEAATVANVISALPPKKPRMVQSTPTRIEPTIDVLPSKLTRAANIIVWHPAAVEPDGSYDVIVHFHGVQTALEPAMREA